MDTVPPINDAQLTLHKEADHEISVFVATGVKLDGKIIKFDKDSVILTSNFPEGVLIERSMITTIMRRSAPRTQEQHEHVQEGQSKRGRFQGR
jgi:sRNA-binding regulator protein Hfq